jgi:hypothetical protein
MNKKIVYKNGRMNKIIIWIYCNKMQVELLVIKNCMIIKEIEIINNK